MQALLGGRLAADINLVAQIIMLVGLWIGFYFARTGQIPRHAAMQTTMVIANLFFILFVMVPSFYQYIILGGTTGGVVAQLMLVHGLLGLVVQAAGLFLVVQMRTQLLPKRFRIRNFRLAMQWTLGLWTLIFVLGIGIYYYRYLVARPVTGVTASLERFRDAGGILLKEMTELRTAVKERSVPAARRAAERTVNLIEGKRGPRYGDLDKNGTVEDPAEGFGLLTYLRAVTSAALEPQAAALAKDVVGWLTTIREDAGAVLAAPDLGSAETRVEKAVTLAERVSRDGITALVAAAPPMVIVVIDDYLFKPERLTVPRGTTVVWINQENESHTVTADDKKFDSGDMAPGGAFAISIKEGGTVPYYCDYHGGRGGVDMAGVLVVE